MFYSPLALKPPIRFLVLGLVVSVSFFAPLLMRETASAQPPLPIIYEGTATIGGRPAPDGTKITARVGKAESRAVEVQNGRYSLLVADPSREYKTTEDAIGLTIEFFADGVRAAETDVYEEGSFIEKVLNLNFPELPQTGDPDLSELWLVLVAAGVISVAVGAIALRLRPGRAS